MTVRQIGGIVRGLQVQGQSHSVTSMRQPQIPADSGVDVMPAELGAMPAQDSLICVLAHGRLGLPMQEIMQGSRRRGRR
jgi:hypothetical protein